MFYKWINQQRKSWSARLTDRDEQVIATLPEDSAETTIDGVYYLGTAPVGTALNAPAWVVSRRITQSGITQTQFAQGGQASCTFTPATLPGYSYGA